MTNKYGMRTMLKTVMRIKIKIKNLYVSGFTILDWNWNSHILDKDKVHVSGLKAPWAFSWGKGLSLDWWGLPSPMSLLSLLSKISK